MSRNRMLRRRGGVYTGINISSAVANAAGIGASSIKAAGITPSVANASGIGTSAGLAPGGDTLVASLSFVSTSGGSQTNIPHRFWAGFAQGDVPSTHKLVLKSGGTEVTTQYDQTAFWPDGSIRCCVFRAFVPSLSAGATHTWQFYKRLGSYSVSAARTTADITAHDFKTVLNSFTDTTETLVGSGDFTCAANTNIAVAARTRKVATGPNCDVWRTWGKFTDNVGGAENAFLTADDCIEVWTNPSGGAVYGISHSAWVRSGWRAVASPKMYHSLMKRKDGASTLLDFSTTYSFTSANVNTTTNLISGSSLRTYDMVYASGTLPGGLATNTPYWVQRTIATGDIELWPDPAFLSAIVDITTGGAGTCTLTRVSYHLYHGGCHTRDLDGKEEWTAHEPLIDPAFTFAERNYLAKAGLAYPFDAAANPATWNTVEYYPGSMAVNKDGLPDSNSGFGIRASGMDSGGEHDALYTWGKLSCTAWQKMDSISLQACRVLGLCYSHITGTWLDEAIISGNECYKIPTINNGPLGTGTSYSGLGTPAPTTWWQSFYDTAHHSANVTEWDFFGLITATTRDDILELGPCTISQGSHYQNIAYVGYLLTGDPHLLETLYQNATSALTREGIARTRTYRGVTYYANYTQLAEVRSEAYLSMHVVQGAAMAPATDPESVYLADVVNSTLAYMVDYENHTDASYAAGCWGPLGGDAITPTIPPQSSYSMLAGGYQRDWTAMSWIYTGKLWGTANSLQTAQHFANYFTSMGAPGSFMGTGPYMANCYTVSQRAKISDTAWLAPALWGTEGATPTYFTVDNIAHIYTTDIVDLLQENDRFYCCDYPFAPDGGPTAGPIYYLINVVPGTTEATAQLSLTPSGSPITFTPPTPTFTASATTDILTTSVGTNLLTGFPVKVAATTGTLSVPLVAGTTYFWRAVSTLTGKLATTKANALAGITIDLTTDGTPANTITGAGHARGLCALQITNTVGFGGGSSDYAQLLASGACLASAHGLISSSIATNLLARLSDMGWPLSQQSKMFMSPTVL